MSLFSREIELFDFSMGDRHWRYADVDRDVVVGGGITYTAARGLKRSRFVDSPEESKNTLEITAPIDLSLLSIFRPYPPMALVHLRVLRIRVSDGFVSNAWSGIVSDVSNDDYMATIRAETLMAVVSGNGLRRCWQVACPLALYSRGVGACNVVEDEFRVDGVVQLSAGTTLKASAIDAKDDGWFKGGFIRWQVDGEFDFRFVVSHVGDTLTLLTPAAIPIGTDVAFFPGCDHTLTMCDEKFDNAENYGGQHTIPKPNPFGSDPVF